MGATSCGITAYLPEHMSCNTMGATSGGITAYLPEHMSSVPVISWVCAHSLVFMYIVLLTIFVVLVVAIVLSDCLLYDVGLPVAPS